VVFASFLFLFWFLPLFLPVYLCLPLRWRNLWLIAGSFVFYAWWRPQYVLLMVGSTLLDHVAARQMDRTGSVRVRRGWLLASIIGNLSLLGWFKYANLFVATWNELAPWPVVMDTVLLPVGISFFTFQSMSYTIDVYRGEVKPVRSFLDLLCYVSMFPQLVAGPIVRYRDVAAQLVQRTINLKCFADGVLLFSFGLAKKVLIADRVAPLVESVFGGSAAGLVSSWAGALGYTVQIYFDFSGYSDMAIGLGWMLGFRFPPNFRSPYKAHSITEFWKRWHISLSTWLRDYLYVPLGGNRAGGLLTYRNLLLTMLLGGLWHGAAWTFLLWGAWQGLFLILERRLGKVAPYGVLPHWLQVACTLVLVVFGWVIFKATSVAQVGALWSAMLGGRGVGSLPELGDVARQSWVALGLGLCIALFLPRSDQLVQRAHPASMLLALVLLLAAIAQLLASDFIPFLYFQF